MTAKDGAYQSHATSVAKTAAINECVAEPSYSEAADEQTGAPLHQGRRPFSSFNKRSAIRGAPIWIL